MTCQTIKPSLMYMYTPLPALEKKLEFQLVLGVSSSLIELAWGHHFLALGNDFLEHDLPGPLPIMQVSFTSYYSFQTSTRDFFQALPTPTPFIGLSKTPYL